MPVHLYGIPCDLDAIAAAARRHGLALVEDCAQAHGAMHRQHPVGAAAVAAAWSFYPTKNLGAVGDAGALTTGSPEVAARLRRLRNYGQATRYEHVELGFNSRLDPLQAAILAVKLRHLPGENARRRVIAARYDAQLGDVEALAPVRIPSDRVPSRHLYPVRLRNPSLRDAFQKELAARGVETLIHYPIPMPDQKATPPAWRRHDRYPAARRFCSSVVSLPVHPDLTDEQVEHVVATIRDWAGRAG